MNIPARTPSQAPGAGVPPRRCYLRRLGLAFAGIAALGAVAVDGRADGDVAIVQVRTDASPGVHFDAVRTVLYNTDGSILTSSDQFADPARDYGLGVRVLEFTMGPGFDHGGTFPGVTSLLLGGGLVVERPFRLHYPGHAHGVPNHRPLVRVITVLLARDFAPLPPPFKVATLEEDRDSSGGVSAGDVVRYTIPFYATHALADGSYFRDFPDFYHPLVPGSVSTSHGRVVSGNLPGDIEIAVRFDGVEIDDIVEVTYKVRVSCLAPEIVNQGIFNPRLAGATVHYRVLTDDPLTPAPEDPTVVPVACGGDEPAPGIAASIPPIVPQHTAATVRVESIDLGTDDGAPAMSLAGFEVQTEAYAPDGDVEAVGAMLTPEMTAKAGVIPFTLFPVNPQLPPVQGVIGVRAAPGTPREIVDQLGESVAAEIGAHLDEALAAAQQARAHARQDPASCKALRRELKSDLDRIAARGAQQIHGLGAAALQQLAALDGEDEDGRQIEHVAASGAKLLNKLIEDARKKGGKGDGSKKGQGRACL